MTKVVPSRAKPDNWTIHATANERKWTGIKRKAKISIRVLSDPTALKSALPIDFLSPKKVPCSFVRRSAHAYACFGAANTLSRPKNA